MEAKDALLAALSPALSLPHLLRHGRRIAQSFARQRPRRRQQLYMLRRFAQH